LQAAFLRVECVVLPLLPVFLLSPVC